MGICGEGALIDSFKGLSDKIGMEKTVDIIAFVHRAATEMPARVPFPQTFPRLPPKGYGRAQMAFPEKTNLNRCAYWGKAVGQN
jgi:hypothetical protein